MLERPRKSCPNLRRLRDAPRLVVAHKATVAAEVALAQQARVAAEGPGPVPQVADPEATALEAHQPILRGARRSQVLPETQHQLPAGRTVRTILRPRRHHRSLGPIPRALPRHQSRRSPK